MSAAQAPTVDVDGSPAGPPPSVGRKGLKGVGWVGMAQGVGLVIRLASNLIMTRLLTPADYGIFGTALAVMMTLEFLCDIGVVPALMRHPRGSSRPFLNAGWWMGVLRGLCLSTAVAALAWPLAMIYRQPELLPVLLLLAARPALMALRSPALPVLRRQLNYRILFFDEVAQNVVGTAITLALVWQFRSVWSIAMGGLVGAAAAVAISYALCPLRPLWGWDRSAARELSHTGRQILVNTLVMSIWMNLDRLLGLRLLEPQQLGLYTVAWNLAAIAEALIGRAAGVYFSMLVSTEDAEARADRHRRFSGYLVVWIMPAMGLGIVAAPLAIDLLYDSRYGGARPLLAILTARLMFRCLGHFQFQYLMALGLIRLETRSYAVGALFQALALVPLVRMWGVTGMALSGLLSAAVQAGTQAVLMRLHSRAPLAPLLVTTGWAAAGLLTALIVDWLSSP